MEPNTAPEVILSESDAPELPPPYQMDPPSSTSQLPPTYQEITDIPFPLTNSNRQEVGARVTHLVAPNYSDTSSETLV